MSKKTVLITGAAGFIGSNLVEYLLDKDYDVYGVDDLSNGKIQFLTSIPKFDIKNKFYYMDFVDKRIMINIMKQKFDVIFHLAAKPRVAYSVANPVETNDTNVSKTLALIDLARGNIQRFVFSSSSSVYGDALERPTKESTVHNPKSPYALQKSIIEKYLEQYYCHFGLDSCALRYFNVMGKNQLGNSPYSTVVSAWLDALKYNKPLRVDGTGEQSRDMCPVENVCLANYLAAEYNGNLKAEAFNVACGDSVTNNQILKSLLSKHGSNAGIVSAPFRPGDVMHTLADISKIRAILGYEPQIKFWDALLNTAEWYRTFLEKDIDVNTLELNPQYHIPAELQNIVTFKTSTIHYAVHGQNNTLIPE